MGLVFIGRGEYGLKLLSGHLPKDWLSLVPRPTLTVLLGQSDSVALCNLVPANFDSFKAWRLLALFRLLWIAKEVEIHWLEELLLEIRAFKTFCLIERCLLHSRLLLLGVELLHSRIVEDELRMLSYG